MRPTFNRHLWIFLTIILLITCINATNRPLSSESTDTVVETLATRHSGQNSPASADTNPTTANSGSHAPLDCVKCNRIPIPPIISQEQSSKRMNQPNNAHNSDKQIAHYRRHRQHDDAQTNIRNNNYHNLYRRTSEPVSGDVTKSRHSKSHKTDTRNQKPSRNQLPSSNPANATQRPPVKSTSRTVVHVHQVDDDGRRQTITMPDITSATSLLAKAGAPGMGRELVIDQAAEVKDLSRSSMGHLRQRRSLSNENSFESISDADDDATPLDTREDDNSNQKLHSSSDRKSDIRYNKTRNTSNRRLTHPNQNESLNLSSISSLASDVSSQVVVEDEDDALSSFMSSQSFEFQSSAGNMSAVTDSPIRRQNHRQPMVIIDDTEEFDSGLALDDSKSEDYPRDEPHALPLRPIIRGPYDADHDEEMSIVYAEQHTEIKLMCEVDLDISASVWYKNGQSVHAMDRTSRVTDYRFIKEANGGLTITNVMLEDDGKWQCEAENTRGYTENARPVKLVVLDRPKPPYLLIDSRQLDAGNIFVPVKENSELALACISEGGNPKPTLTWEVLLSPGVDRHAQKVAAEVLELEEVKSEKDKLPYKINSGAKSEARLPAVYRAHHNARILCVMEHPTLKIRLNASILLDVKYTPSFAISRTPGFGYPLREGIEVSLKCDVDSNPPSQPRWQKDDGDTPVPQTGDGFLNFTSIRREHSGWYKCTSRHLDFQYSSIGYYLSVRYDAVDVTSEPDDQEVSVAASHNPNKGQMEVQLGGAVTLQCPQGSLGCWSHLDPVTAKLRGLGHGLSTPTGQVSLKDVVYQDAGTYKCIGQSPSNKKKLEVLQTVGVLVKGAPTAMARNATPVAYPGSPLHLAVEFCANPPAHAARWLHGDRVYTPGNQYGSTVLAYGVSDLPTPYCKEARLTYVSMHERVPRTFYFVVSSPGGVAEATIRVNFTMRFRSMSNAIDDEEEELSEPEEIHFPVFGSSAVKLSNLSPFQILLLFKLLLCIRISIDVFL